MAQALDVLVTRLLFLGAPPESIEQSGDTVTASIPAEDGVDLELFTARGALAMHAVDEAGIRALRQQPLPHEVVALEARWDEFMNALMVPVGVSVGDLSAMSVPGRRWMLLPSESPTRPAVLVHPAAITADDVMPCVAREVNDSEFAWMRVRLTEAGTLRFAALTERVAGDRVALAVDEVAWMAPVVQEAIRGGELTISGPRLADHRTHLAVLQRVLPEGVRCTAVPLR